MVKMEFKSYDEIMAEDEFENINGCNGCNTYYNTSPVLQWGNFTETAVGGPYSDLPFISAAINNEAVITTPMEYFVQISHLMVH